MEQTSTPLWRRRGVGHALAALALVGVLAVVWVHVRGGQQAAAGGDPFTEQGVAAAAPAAATEAKLPRTTTFSTVHGAPTDPAPTSVNGGVVLKMAADTVLYVRPGGTAFAVLPKTQLGAPTWAPVAATRPGWAQVLLPSRPNASTGWVKVTRAMTVARSAYEVVVDRGQRTMTLFDDDVPVGAWPVAVGAPGTVTPAGRTYVLAQLQPAHDPQTPYVLPLGAHSDTLDSYGGGPGTVALHSWPDASVFGHAVSHGCIRVPPAALTRLLRVPLGTPVIIR